MSTTYPDNSVLRHDSESTHAIDVSESLSTEPTRMLDKGQEMGPVATKIELNEITYFGIHIPTETQLIEDNALHVYMDKIEALKIVKKFKKARFKAFKSRQEAVQFAVHGSEVLNATSPTIGGSENFDAGSPVVGEKPSLFKGPKAQDLVQLRKAIEYGDLQAVSSTVWNNPRYLVSSGDTPAILQEGSRYNALHVGAKSRNREMCEFIIQTIGDPAFVGLLYGDDDLISCQERAAILLDLYLNTPDKGLNETPLHFAVKFGAVGVVEALVSCPQCDKEPRNKFGQTPRDIVCSRVSTPDAKLKFEIMGLLEERFYVPVLRSDDNSMQPYVGVPFTPTHPPVLNTDPINPRIEIHAYAGPMAQEEAVVFRKKWKTPPRVGRLRMPSNHYADSPAMRLQDTEKGLERVGRSLAQEFKVSWKEYWPFLGIFTDLSSPEGLQKLEVYLKNRFMQVYMKSPPRDNVCDNNQTHENQETLHIASSVAGDGTLSPMSDLCMAFKAISISDQSIAERGIFRSTYVVKRNTNNVINYTQSGDSSDSSENETLLGVLSNPGLSPFLYVEKSCQVFSKRISDCLIHYVESGHNFQSSESVFDLLLPEIKHLQVLVNSYMDDPRFISVDFHLVHSRISTVAAYKLGKLPEEDIKLILFGLRSALSAHKVVDPGSSDEDDTVSSNAKYRTQKCTDKHRKMDVLNGNQVRCVAHYIADALLILHEHEDKTGEVDSRVYSEEDCMRVWSDAVKCKCIWQAQNFTRNTRKGASLKRSHNLKYAGISDVCLASPLDCVTRRLSFGGSSGSTSSEVSSECGQDLQQPAGGAALSDQLSDLGEGDDDVFYTPPSSPADSSSEEEMITADEGLGVYIEGEEPSKMDLSVMQALAACHITPGQFPNVYRWRHLIFLHSEAERNSWATPASMRRQHRARAQSVSSPRTHDATSPHAWHRVAGRYAPANH